MNSCSFFISFKRFYFLKTPLFKTCIIKRVELWNFYRGMSKNQYQRYYLAQQQRYKNNTQQHFLILLHAIRHNEGKLYLCIRSHPWNAHSKLKNDSSNNFEEKISILSNFIHVLNLLIWFRSILKYSNKKIKNLMEFPWSLFYYYLRFIKTNLK